MPFDRKNGFRRSIGGNGEPPKELGGFLLRELSLSMTHDRKKQGRERPDAERSRHPRRPTLVDDRPPESSPESDDLAFSQPETM